LNAIGKAVWYIESHFGEPLSLDDVSRASGLSRFHLSRSFAQATGISLSAYLRGRRLTEAARTLADGAPDILSVALDAGYGSHEAFTRAFRDRFGVTPDEVRSRRGLETLDLLEPVKMSDLPAVTLSPPTYRDPGMLLIAGIREFRGYDDTAAIPAQWHRFVPHIGNVSWEIPGSTYGVVSSSGDEREGFDYMSGVAVRSLDSLPEGLSGIRLQPRRYACFQHHEHVSAIAGTCGAIFEQWLPSSGEQAADGALMLIEHYGPGFDPSTGMGGIEVWIPLKN
jgi:AraC family transcriptional regulator